MNLRQIFAQEDNRLTMVVPFIKDCDDEHKRDAVQAICRKAAEQLAPHLYRWAKEWPSLSAIKTFSKAENKFLGMDLALFENFIMANFSVRTPDRREWMLDRKIAALIFERCIADDSPLPPANYQIEREKQLAK